MRYTLCMFMGVGTFDIVAEDDTGAEYRSQVNAPEEYAVIFQNLKEIYCPDFLEVGGEYWANGAGEIVFYVRPTVKSSHGVATWSFNEGSSDKGKFSQYYGEGAWRCNVWSEE